MVNFFRLPILPRTLIAYHIRASASQCLAHLPQKRPASSTAYTKTINLPRTTFPLKHKQPFLAELEYRKRTTDDLYHLQRARPNPPFILHDGPPYANGHLHMGHALNKILKDIINRFQVIQGKNVSYVPGWDCHGLPIEVKALKALGKSHTSLSPQKIRQAARETASQAILTQKKEFRDLGIMADWETGVYITMDNSYQIRQLKLFRDLVEKGYITHHKRPVYYSPSSHTALAESELVYKEDYTSRSVYVSFPVEQPSAGLQRAYNGKVSLAIWTTTPWSLPGNAGVNVHPEMDYLIVEGRTGILIVAEERRAPLESVLGDLKVLAKLRGDELVGTVYSSTFHIRGQKPVVFASSHVTSQSGTGLVHAAPAHGYQDYVAFSQAGLLPADLRCPIDDEGRFTADIISWADGVDHLVGKEALQEGSDLMVELLAREGSLLAEQVIQHKYPCERSVINVDVWATPQWFANVEAVKPQAVKALKKLRFFPPQSLNRLEAFVTSRSEWCISRQRSWGVPIPALYENDRPILDGDTMDHIIQVLEVQGVDHWWNGPLEDFVPEHLKGKSLKRGSDTLDVWFDSGSSWTMLPAVADVYLEGSDQHRGWFQSSLLTKLGVAEEPPYKSIVTHGFVMDEDGQKMSKSQGNGISPEEIIRGANGNDGAGADVLRVWAGSVDYTRDVSFGPLALAHASETLRKLRSTMRFLLANTADGGTTAEVNLGIFEEAILQELRQVEAVAQEGYEEFNFNKVLSTTTQFTSTILSSFYFEGIKDTLYCDRVDHPGRQAVVETLKEVFWALLKIIAPIAPHLSEELYEHAGGSQPSVFLHEWKQKASPPTQMGLDTVLALRSAVNQLMEQERRAKLAASSAECVLWCQGEGVAALEVYGDTLRHILGVGEIHLDRRVDGPPTGDNVVVTTKVGEIGIRLSRTSRHRCPRCRLYASEKENALCGRCADVIG